MKAMALRLLEERTGEDLATWNRRVQGEGPGEEASLRAWLAERGVTGYPQSLLVMERFGYPDYVVASAEELLEAQYANRPKRRPVFDALINAAVDLGEVIIQTRKTNVSLITPRRTFARIKATTRSRIDLGLRVEGQAASERLQPSRIHETTPLQISLTRPDEVDSEVLAWLRRPYEQNGEGSQV